MLLEVGARFFVCGLNLGGQFVWRDRHIDQIELDVLALVILLDFFIGDVDSGGDEGEQFLRGQIITDAALEALDVAVGGDDSLFILIEPDELARQVAKLPANGRGDFFVGSSQAEARRFLRGDASLNNLVQQSAVRVAELL